VGDLALMNSLNGHVGYFLRKSIRDCHVKHTEFFRVLYY